MQQNTPNLLNSIAQIWRYPVKSMHGESVLEAQLTVHGLQHDRHYAFESAGAPLGMLRLTGHGRSQILRFHARTGPEGSTVVTSPAGQRWSVDDPALRENLQTTFSDGHLLQLTQEDTPQTDCRPLSLISYQTIDLLSTELGLTLDPRRFRANLYLDLPNLPGPFPEDHLVGKFLTIGEHATVRILERDPRCRFITLDPETSEPLPNLMKVLDRLHNGRAGVYAAVQTPGPVQVGDAVRILRSP